MGEIIKVMVSEVSELNDKSNDVSSQWVSGVSGLNYKSNVVRGQLIL